MPNWPIRPAREIELSDLAEAYGHGANEALDIPAITPYGIELARDGYIKWFIHKTFSELGLSLPASDEQLDPLNDEYLGHNLALCFGQTQCCCEKSILDCPFHGR